MLVSGQTNPARQGRRTPATQKKPAGQTRGDWIGRSVNEPRTTDEVFGCRSDGHSVPGRQTEWYETKSKRLSGLESIADALSQSGAYGATNGSVGSSVKFEHAACSAARESSWYAGRVCTTNRCCAFGDGSSREGTP